MNKIILTLFLVCTLGSLFQTHPVPNDDKSLSEEICETTTTTTTEPSVDYYVSDDLVDLTTTASEEEEVTSFSSSVRTSPATIRPQVCNVTSATLSLFDHSCHGQGSVHYFISVNFTASETKMTMEVRLRGLLPTKTYSAYLLEKQCTELIHFNPLNKSHGDQQDEDHHVGDLLQNIKIYGDTTQTIVRTFYLTDEDSPTLCGTNKVMGHSLLLALGPDDEGKGGNDQSEIDGNSGPKVCCGGVWKTT